uniref:Uncharacterized protein n=1 Tax=Timema shepardi TaxID=629360 RepID=A0A7R9AN14_TIMSH|nr:unnamed protein product [Timema shepardi]
MRSQHFRCVHSILNWEMENPHKGNESRSGVVCLPSYLLAHCTPSNFPSFPYQTQTKLLNRVANQSMEQREEDVLHGFTLAIDLIADDGKIEALITAAESCDAKEDLEDCRRGLKQRASPSPQPPLLLITGLHTGRNNVLPFGDSKIDIPMNAAVMLVAVILWLATAHALDTLLVKED